MCLFQVGSSPEESYHVSRCERETEKIKLRISLRYMKSFFREKNELNSGFCFTCWDTTEKGNPPDSLSFSPEYYLSKVPMYLFIALYLCILYIRNRRAASLKGFGEHQQKMIVFEQSFLCKQGTYLPNKRPNSSIRYWEAGPTTPSLPPSAKPQLSGALWDIYDMWSNQLFSEETIWCHKCISV